MWTGQPALGFVQHDVKRPTWARHENSHVGLARLLLAKSRRQPKAKRYNAVQCKLSMFKNQQTTCVVQILCMSPGPMCKGHCLNLHRRVCLVLCNCSSLHVLLSVGHLASGRQSLAETLEARQSLIDANADDEGEEGAPVGSSMGFVGVLGFGFWALGLKGFVDRVKGFTGKLGSSISGCRLPSAAVKQCIQQRIQQ